MTRHLHNCQLLAKAAYATVSEGHKNDFVDSTRGRTWARTGVQAAVWAFLR